MRVLNDICNRHIRRDSHFAPYSMPRNQINLADCDSQSVRCQHVQLMDRCPLLICVRAGNYRQQTTYSEQT